MAQIAYILLCHKAPDQVIAQAQLLVSTGDFVAIHYDARAPRAEFERIAAALRDHPRIAFAPRVRCGWGEWSLVEATLGACRSALARFPETTHLYTVSGDCMPVAAAETIRTRLGAEDADFVECVDFHSGGWIRTGLREERLRYRHFFNERDKKGLFYLTLGIQQRLGLSRRPPSGLSIRIGSQWWCLRRGTVEAILDFIGRRPDVPRFFRTTWIPDETFFQTLVPHLVPEPEIRSRPPTFLMFTDYGMPVTFMNDHHDLLVSQDAFFARKISPRATPLRQRLAERFAGAAANVPPATDGKRLFQFLTTRGREGRRFAPRIWEPATPGPGRRLGLIVCKKWHVAKRLTAAIRAHAGHAAVDYPFNENACPLPDMGGLEKSVGRRSRDRRAFTSALLGALGADRLVLCLDPANLDAIRELHGHGAFSRLLEVTCALDDAYLTGHAARIGLDPPGLLPVLPALASELRHESARLGEAGFPNHLRIAEGDPPETIAARLSEFLDISPACALEIAATPNLFAD